MPRPKRSTVPDEDKAIEYKRLRFLKKAATKAGHVLKRTHSGYLLHTAAGTLMHMTDIKLVASTLGRMSRAAQQAGV